MDDVSDRNQRAASGPPPAEHPVRAARHTKTIVVSARKVSLREVSADH